MNGDGFADVLVGAPDEILVVSGPSPRAVVYSGADGVPLFTVLGEPGDGFGYSVADAGDVNGDGVPDIVVGAGADSELAYKAGSAIVYSGAKLALVSPDHTLPYPGGGTLPMRLNAGPTHAGELYVLLGSLSGIAPGVPLGDVVLPLAPDAYLAYTANHPGAAPLSGSIGTLPPSGVALAHFTAPPDLPASYHGLTFHHAFVTVDLASGAIALASNAVPVSLIPPSELH